ncbi:hypothetical protein [Antarctobacter jejuensis]|uniref:hypothetical protein n=1 Tax=Antarctobacter jejuensis TaxID=1439938 RepID=UPI003FD1D66E
MPEQRVKRSVSIFAEAKTRHLEQLAKKKDQESVPSRHSYFKFGGSGYWSSLAAYMCAESRGLSRDEWYTNLRQLEQDVHRAITEANACAADGSSSAAEIEAADKRAKQAIEAAVSYRKPPK